MWRIWYFFFPTASFFSMLKSSPSHTTPKAMRDLNRLAKIFHFNSWNKSTRTWVSLLPFPLSLIHTVTLRSINSMARNFFCCYIRFFFLGMKTYNNPTSVCIALKRNEPHHFFLPHQKAFFQLQKNSFASMWVRQRREKKNEGKL